LFNWLFARHEGGAFVLRIEDTDVERSEKGYESQLVEDLRWFGLDWDEGPDKGGPFGPYRQSERQDLYAQFAKELVGAGRGYFCFCSAEQLEAERQDALKAGRQPKYSGRCRTLAAEEAARRVKNREPAAIRLKIEPGEFRWQDLVHGEVVFSSDVIGDPILVRSGGHPGYNYAVVIDDHMMQISHVIRGDDHISNTPRQLALYRALGWEPPAFAHLSTILGPDRARLSKRHGATSLQNFREEGILPEALRNYLALLGWSPADGKTEILGGDALAEQFSLAHVTKSPAVFDAEKLAWMNRQYMKGAAPECLARLSAPFLVKATYLAEPIAPATMAWIERVLDATLKNLDRLDQLPAATRLIFDYDATTVVSSEETRHVAEDPAARQVLAALIPKVLADESLTFARFREIAKEVQKETGKKGKDLFHPIRVAVTGAVSGPELEKLIPIFEEGAKLNLAKPIKSTAERLREFAAAARLE